MRGVNKVILIGRLGQDPEIRKMDNMRSKLLISVATTESYKNSNGEWTDITDWHSVVMWGPMAERGERDLHKGNMVYIEGKLKTRSWEDKDGQKRYTTEVLADSYQNLSPKEQGSKDQYGNTTPSDSSKTEDFSTSGDNDDVLPF
jgi:single-strand DNA-binding protein